MPTHTPSPHRFLAPPPPSTQKKSKPQSSLRNGFTAQTPKPSHVVSEKSELQFKKLTPAKRFVVGQHRPALSTESNGKNKDKDETFAQPNSKPKPRRRFERVESIEEPRSSPSASLEDDDCHAITHPIEHDSTHTQERPDHDEDELLFTIESNAKRRRISSSPPITSVTQTSNPTTPPTAHTHRFLIPPPRTPLPFPSLSNTNSNAQPTPTTNPAPSRPHFILPQHPTSPQKPSNPLPEIFSPSRKHAKYVPEGLAATMQGFILDVANTGVMRDGGGSKGKDDSVKMKVRVGGISGSGGSSDVSRKDNEVQEIQCFPGTFTFIHGTTQPGLYNQSRAPEQEDGEVKLLLAGQGLARGAGGVNVKFGSIVGLKPPMWDVQVGGQTWIVGVDWIVTNQ